MGSLRLILAISVVIGHSSPIFGISLVGGQTAVQAFYIISGFYMALILKEKYINQNSSYWLFITNRLIRLFPIYWSVLLLILFVGVLSYTLTDGQSMIGLQPYIAYSEYLDFSAAFFLLFTNIFLMFQDIVMFMGIDLNTSSLFFTSNFRDSTPMLYEFILVPQAWTISLEILFYLIAPFLLRLRIRYILFLMLISIILRFFLFKNGLNYDPWTYRFFPTELLFFLSGIISYYIYKVLPTYPKLISKLFLISIYVLTFIFQFYIFSGKNYLYLFIFFISLPFIFNYTKAWKRDRLIGELSYPVYICHYFILNIMIHFNFELYQGLFLVISSIFLSILLNKYVTNKVENYRQSRLKFK